MFYFRYKLMFERKKKNKLSQQAHKAYMATKAHKLTLYFPIPTLHRIITLIEIHVGACLHLTVDCLSAFVAALH